MKLVTYAQNLHDLNLIKNQNFTEVILGHRDYSRFGKLDDSMMLQMTTRARELGLRVLFEWDILMTQGVFEKLSGRIHEFSFDALRVQDPGALEWSLKNLSSPLQFIAETGNHNLTGLETWCRYAKDRLERIVLSIELSRDVIENYCQKLPVPCELLGLGRILLFYTPRGLLRPLTVNLSDEIVALGSSEESPHKGFPVIENKHGTFMFHIKEFCILDHLDELIDSGLDTMRIDLRWSGLEFLESAVNFSQDFKDTYPQDLMKGFYNVNKTDVLFPKLKNHRLQNREGGYVGEVLEAEKGSHLAIMVKNPQGLKISDCLKISPTLGTQIEVKIYSLRTSSLEDVEFVGPNQLALIQFVGGVGPKSLVFLNQRTSV